MGVTATRMVSILRCHFFTSLLFVFAHETNLFPSNCSKTYMEMSGEDPLKINVFDLDLRRYQELVQNLTESSSTSTCTRRTTCTHLLLDFDRQSARGSTSEIDDRMNDLATDLGLFHMIERYHNDERLDFPVAALSLLLERVASTLVSIKFTGDDMSVSGRPLEFELFVQQLSRSKVCKFGILDNC